MQPWFVFTQAHCHNNALGVRLGDLHQSGPRPFWCALRPVAHAPSCPSFSGVWCIAQVFSGQLRQKKTGGEGEAILPALHCKNNYIGFPKHIMLCSTVRGTRGCPADFNTQGGPCVQRYLLTKLPTTATRHDTTRHDTSLTPSHRALRVSGSRIFSLPSSSSLPSVGSSTISGN